ncbi:MAG: hypothetical protein AUG84_01670 [Chloroflexi bacterium 13_1_20CM_4_66_7]|nr:MAG: hypothetical protein AUG84_01670 [Chloroflexi bacterium 13_1_20CM_4_66_7]
MARGDTRVRNPDPEDPRAGFGSAFDPQRVGPRELDGVDAVEPEPGARLEGSIAAEGEEQIGALLR